MAAATLEDYMLQNPDDEFDPTQPRSFNPANASPTTGISPGQTAAPVAPAPTPTAAAAVGTYMPGGYDSTKWNDPNKHDPKYDVGRLLSQYQPNPTGLQQAAPELQKMGYTVTGKDQITGPDGTTYDVGTAFGQAAATGSGGSWGWNPTSGPGGAALPSAPSAGATGGLGSALMSGQGFNFGGPLSGFNDSYLSQSGIGSDPRVQSLFDALMKIGNQSTDVNAQDPIIANQVNAFQARNERAGRNYLKDQAEREGPYGNLNSESRMVAENLGQNTGAFQAELMGQELNARRSQILDALKAGAGFITEQQRLDLSRELGLLNAAMDRMNLQQRAYEFDTSDEFRRSPLAS